MPSKRRVLLVQLPIPPAGPEPVRGNVPLAAGYLKLMARRRGLDGGWAIEILDPRAANTLSDAGLAAAIAARRPELVGFTCYLWNIERSLWIAERVKQLAPEVKIILGGPEITADNAWVLGRPEVDFAAIGEGEQTFAELLSVADRGWDVPAGAIDGLYVRDPRAGQSEHNDGLNGQAMPRFRAPLANLDEVSSPYTAGILDAADEQMLLLETIRGCIFKCKFCYYPKSYNALYFASRERIAANLADARERGARGGAARSHAEPASRLCRLSSPAGGGKPGSAVHLFWRAARRRDHERNGPPAAPANFEEVEIGLQSVDPLAQQLMDRPNNLRTLSGGRKRCGPRASGSKWI